MNEWSPPSLKKINKNNNDNNNKDRLPQSSVEPGWNTVEHGGGDPAAGVKHTRHGDQRSRSRITIAGVRRWKWWAAPEPASAYIAAKPAKKKKPHTQHNRGSKHTSWPARQTWRFNVQVAWISFPPALSFGVFKHGLLSAMAPAWQGGFAGLELSLGSWFRTVFHTHDRGKSER